MQFEINEAAQANFHCAANLIAFNLTAAAIQQLRQQFVDSIWPSLDASCLPRCQVAK